MPRMDVHVRSEPVSTTQLDTEDEPFIFTTTRWDPALVSSAENTAVSCYRPCPIYMFEHHYTRLQVAKWSLASWADEYRCCEKSDSKPATHLSRGPSSPAELLRGLLNAVEVWKESHPAEQPESLRIKFRLYLSGKMRTEIFNPIPRVGLETLFPRDFGLPEHHRHTLWSVFLDAEPTEPTESTMIKTSDRAAYDRARANAGIKSYAELKEVLLYRSDQTVLDGSLSTPYVYRNGQWITPASSSGGQQGVTRRWALTKHLAIEGTVSSPSLELGEVIMMSNAVKGFFAAIFRGRPAKDAEQNGAQA